MNYLEIKHLRMIRAIAETGNMTRAAGILYITQSALSQQLKDIENKLQVDLFHRTRKKMVLTPSGYTLLQTAEKVVNLVDDTEVEIAKLAGGESGELRVGTHCIFCFKWLPAVVADFREKFPGVELEIGTSTEPERELEQKKYDLVISARPPADRYDHQVLFRDQLVCIMERGHPLSGQSYIRVEDFHDINLISHAEKRESKVYELLLQPKGIEPKRFMSVGQPQAIVELVMAGLGVSIFPLWAITSAVETGGLVARPISRNGIPLTWNALSLKGNNTPIYQQEFVRMIREMNIAAQSEFLSK